jgi:hypothetical protein
MMQQQQQTGGADPAARPKLSRSKETNHALRDQRINMLQDESFLANQPKLAQFIFSNNAPLIQEKMVKEQEKMMKEASEIYAKQQQASSKKRTGGGQQRDIQKAINKQRQRQKKEEEEENEELQEEDEQQFKNVRKMKTSPSSKIKFNQDENNQQAETST